MADNSNSQSGSLREKKEKEQKRREELSKYLYDISKILVAGMFVVNIIPIVQGDFSMEVIIPSVMGGISAFSFAWSANRLLIY